MLSFHCPADIISDESGSDITGITGQLPETRAISEDHDRDRSKAKSTSTEQRETPSITEGINGRATRER